jgi:putative ABC transport system permease protein
LRAEDLAAFALTALARHRVRTGLSLLGVSIGVAAVVLLTALGEGARRYVTAQFDSIGSNLLFLMPGRNETSGFFPGVGGVPNDLTIDDVRALERGLPNLALTAPLASGQETVSHRGRSRRVTVLGATESLRHLYDLHVARGRFLPRGDLDRGGPEVVLGAGLARELVPNGDPLGRVVRIGDWRMRVIGVLEPKGHQIGMNVDDLAVVPLATTLRIFDRSSLRRIVMRTHRFEELDTTCQRALAILEDRHGEDDVTCFTQESVVSSLSTILTILTAALGGIAAISLSVAGIGIMNVMLVSVSERTSEVGLLVAVGARRRQILAVFLAEAILLAVIGGLCGVALGWLGIRALVLLYPAFPAAMPLWAVAAALLTSIVAGAIFGVLPARRASLLDPVAALAER